jgi:hypothetical protein
MRPKKCHCIVILIFFGIYNKAPHVFLGSNQVFYNICRLYPHHNESGGRLHEFAEIFCHNKICCIHDIACVRLEILD